MTDYPYAARRRRRTIILSMATLLAMVVAVGLAATHSLSGKSGAKSKTAMGVVSIANRAFYVTTATGSAAGSASQCHGTGDYTDLEAGGTVTILDDGGNVLATTNLQPGTVDVNGFCELPFSAPGVPTNRGPYGIQITRRKVFQPVNADVLFSLLTLTFGNT